MKEVFVVGQNEEIFGMFAKSLAYLPVHFSWMGHMDTAEAKLKNEKPDFIFFAAHNVSIINNWIARYKSYRLNIPFICFIPKTLWEKRELLWMAGAAGVIELPKLNKEFKQILETVLIPQSDKDTRKKGLSGNLNFFNITDLIKMCEEGKRNGAIELISRNRIANLQFNKGKLVNAAYRDFDPLDAVLHMSLWKEGSYSIHLDNVQHIQKIKLENSQIINECQNYIIEQDKAMAELPELDRVFYAAPLINYEEIAPDARKKLLFFKLGKSLEEFLDENDDLTPKQLYDVKIWVRQKGLIDKKEYNAQKKYIKDMESTSKVKILFNKVFAKNKAEKSFGDIVLENSKDINNYNKGETKIQAYQFKDMAYLNQFYNLVNGEENEKDN